MPTSSFMAHLGDFELVESYTYDLTSTLQHNLIGCQRVLNHPWPFSDRFAWNLHMMSAACQSKGEDGKQHVIKPHWFLPLVHGHVDQASKCSNCPQVFLE